VIRAFDAGKARMEAVLAELATEAAGAEIGVVYFAGHGTERAGRNYLIPVDAKLARASDLDLQAVALSTVVDQLGGATKLKLVILDACRNNSFPLAGAKRTTSRGLARIEPDDNTLIAYAAREGTVADDGPGRRHSPFTEALLKHVATQGIEVDYVFRLVRDDVVKATSGQQTPHIYGTLGHKRIYFRPPYRRHPQRRNYHPRSHAFPFQDPGPVHSMALGISAGRDRPASLGRTSASLCQLRAKSFEG
jgi:uncharacterized caspase-like protein